MITLKNIVVSYRGVEALKGVSLEAEAGSVTALIGANGAGKSTCVRAISGLVPLTSGEIWFENKRIDGMAPEKIVALGIAHVPERRRLFPWMSVYDNLMTGAYLRNDKAGIEKDLEMIYERFPVLKARLRQQVRNLSGGEQQMLAISRGLLCKPKLLILDEPSLGLAPIVVAEMAHHITEFVKAGYSVILIEQNSTMALTLAKKAYVLEEGKIALEGDPEQLRNSEHVRKAYLGI
jgi:branched-chain amino acid transport system ATP-binding protein